MESIDVVENPVENDTQEKTETESEENFQKFIYELFEKNGVLNDLRAYLRGHIVEVLKKAQTGDTPACQINFTQRLDLTYQALNMLVAEYLLSMEFNYSLSVFLSEIPLANMVFDYSKTLLQINADNSSPRFKESDVWSILNYLGIKCDSEHALNMVKMYKNDERLSLLLCLLKCMPMYRSETCDTAAEQENSSTVSLCSNKSCDTLEDNKSKSCHKAQSEQKEKCKHYVVCKPCHQKYKKAKELYKASKVNMNKAETTQAFLKIIRTKTFMKDICIIEQDLINEMFEQLRSVYETEVEMAKREEETRIKQSLMVHARQLKKHRDEMEETFKQREAELERSVQQKKQFLWGLARALRAQHAALARAVHAVRQETRRLSHKEESLKLQLLDAERVMAKRGEQMRAQISEELAILEAHLDSMKRERENISKERSHLEQLKSMCEGNSNIVKANQSEVREDLRSHYDLLKSELSILRKYLDSSKLQAKCVIERSTMTEFAEEASKMTIVLNNEQEADRCPYLREEDRCPRALNQLVNDFKKKNVNFDQVMQSTEDMFETEEPASGGEDEAEQRDVIGSRPCDVIDSRQCDVELARQRDVIALLTAENLRLRAHAEQYRQQMEELSRLQARLPPPPPFPAHSFSAHIHRVPSSSRTNAMCADGAGEQLSALRTGRPRVLLPTDTVPFIGALAADARDQRRYVHCWTQQLSALRTGRPRVLLPTDTMPFIGALAADARDQRRHLVSQWRALRRRASLAHSPARAHAPRPSSAGATTNPGRCPDQDTAGVNDHMYTYEPPAREPPAAAARPKTPLVLDTPRNREKSPKTVLKEVKGKLRNKVNIKDAPVKREKSPNSVLREAKLRLRKLEIEAEAVEKSYLDFRKRQSRLSEERQGYEEDGTLGAIANEEAVVTKDIGGSDVRHSTPEQKNTDDPPETQSMTPHYIDSQAMKDLDKYLREYHTKLEMRTNYLQNVSLTAAKPIPESFLKIDKPSDDTKPTENFNYLETPLNEFRKLYNVQRPAGPYKIIDNDKNDTTQSDVRNCSENIHDTNKFIHDRVNRSQFEAIKNALLKEQNSKKAELAILRRNINQIYDLKETPATLTPDKRSLGDPASKGEPSKMDTKDNGEKSKLRIEIETSSHTNCMKMTNSEPENVLVMVESSVAHAVAASDSEGDARNLCPNMTILISPKRSKDKLNHVEECVRVKTPERRRSVSPEQAAKLTRNDVLDAIFHGDPLRESSHTMHGSRSKDAEDAGSEPGKSTHEDYPDDFSADVDNYNSSSPISLPKTDDESFW